MKRRKPTAATMRKHYSYDPETGILTQEVDERGYLVGRPIGALDKGYLRIGFRGKLYFVHRVAWLLMTGEWPPDGMDMDHINRVRSDNRWANLRLATRSQNRFNVVSNKRTLPKGVHYASDPYTLPYRAIVGVNNKSIHLGYFATVEEANAAAIAGRLLHHGKEWMPEHNS